MTPQALFSQGQAENFIVYKQPEIEIHAWKGKGVWNIKVSFSLGVQLNTLNTSSEHKIDADSIKPYIF